MFLNNNVGNQQININFNFGGANGVESAKDVLTDLLDLFKPSVNDSRNIFNKFLNHPINFTSHPAPVEAPSIRECCQPQGTLTTDGNKVKTAGGYTIEPLSQFEWKITGPDGKETRVWGDPHVEEGDGGKFDFKRNSTFVLGDGTKINVTTVPFGNGATVTGKLEIISGNDRVEVTDIDKGKGVIGPVTQDGYAHANSFQGDVFVQGKETDDWSLNGKEIIGSEDQGETLKLGGDLEAGSPRRNTGVGTPTRGIDQMFNRFVNNRSWLMDSLRSIFSSAFTPHNRLGANPYSGNSRPLWEGNQHYDRGLHRKNLTRSFQNLSKMFDMLSRMSNLNDRLSTMRHRSNLYA